MRKTIAMLLIATTVLFGVFANGSGESAASGDTYVIGFMGPLTGDNANYGIRCNNATQLAVSEINAAGGINGKQLEVRNPQGRHVPRRLHLQDRPVRRPPERGRRTLHV